MEEGGVSKHFLVLRSSFLLTTSSSFFFLLVSFDPSSSQSTTQHTPISPCISLANLCFRADPREFLISCGLRFIPSAALYNFQRSSEGRFSDQIGIGIVPFLLRSNEYNNEFHCGWVLSQWGNDEVIPSHFRISRHWKGSTPFLHSNNSTNCFRWGKWNEFIVKNSSRPRRGNTDNSRAKAPYYSVNPL